MLKANPGLDLTSELGQDLVRGSASPYSLVSQLTRAAKYPNITYISEPPNSWLDSFAEWIGNDKCCRYKEGKDGGKESCPSSLKSSHDRKGPCKACKIRLKDGHIPSQAWDTFFPFFLEDNPSLECPKGGHALFSKAVKWDRKKGKGQDEIQIGDTFFMAFNKVLKSSQDFTQSMIEARALAMNVTDTMNAALNRSDVEVFPYSPIYIFYEQFLTIWRDTLVSLGISFGTVLIMTWAVLLDGSASVLILTTIFMIVVDVGGLMYFWGITLNGVSLVNLVVVRYVISLCLRKNCKLENYLFTGGGNIGGILYPYCPCLFSMSCRPWRD